jgi:hypothetical protein
MNRTLRVATAAGALWLAVAAVEHGRAQSTSPTPLTAMDHAQIRQLAARATFAMDTGADNGLAYANLFTADGESVRPNAKGREQLAALARGGRRGPLLTSLYSANHIIEPAPGGGAVGKQYVIAIDHDDEGTFAGSGGRSQYELVGQKRGSVSPMGGHYEDVYVKTSEGWKFRRRAFFASASGKVPPGAESPRAHASVPARVVDDGATVGPSRLTAADFFEIERLVGSYGHALDNGWGKEDGGESYAQNFTEDGVFRKVAGHQALAALAREQVTGPQWVRHFLTNIVIEPTATGASGKQYIVVLDLQDRETGKPGTIFLGGHYEDTYVRTPQGWRFKTRTRVGSKAGTPSPK